MHKKQKRIKQPQNHKKMENYEKTLCNLLFHPRKVIANFKLKQNNEFLINLAPEFIDEIGEVTYVSGVYHSAKITGVASLPELVRLHKELWQTGFQNDALGPYTNNNFRTASIDIMVPTQVFLGGTQGLSLENIPFWESNKDNIKPNEEYPIYQYLTPYQVILGQYKDILTSNILYIQRKLLQENDRLKNLGY